MYYINIIKDPKLIQEIKDEYDHGEGLPTGVIAKNHDIDEVSVIYALGLD